MALLLVGWIIFSLQILLLFFFYTHFFPFCWGEDGSLSPEPLILIQSPIVSVNYLSASAATLRSSFSCEKLSVLNRSSPSPWHSFLTRIWVLISPVWSPVVYFTFCICPYELDTCLLLPNQSSLHAWFAPLRRFYTVCAHCRTKFSVWCNILK